MQDKLPVDAIQGMINRLEDKFTERFNRVDDRLEKMDDKIDVVSKTTDKNTVVLEEHQRRALANEKHSHLLELKMKEERIAIANALLKSDDKIAEALLKADDKQATALLKAELTLANALLQSNNKQNDKVQEIADSVDLFVKFPKYLYRIAIWLAAISAGGAALYAIFRFAFSNVIQ